MLVFAIYGRRWFRHKSARHRMGAKEEWRVGSLELDQSGDELIADRGPHRPKLRRRQGSRLALIPRSLDVVAELDRPDQRRVGVAL
jgi:hypothetical protein